MQQVAAQKAAADAVRQFNATPDHMPICRHRSVSGKMVGANTSSTQQPVPNRSESEDNDDDDGDVAAVATA